MKYDLNTLSNLVKGFQEARLTDDHAQMVKLEIAGRTVLYEQLAEAYRIGLILLTKSHTTMFCHLLTNAQMKEQADKHEAGKAPNPWRYVTGLLYGKWIEREYANTVFHSFEPNRSAEKYAVVFRYVEELGIKPEALAQYIADFQHEEGNKLAGLERVASKHFRKASGSVPVVDEVHVRNGRSRAESDVFEFEPPASFKGQFGQLFFEIVDGKAVALGVTELEQLDFEELAAKRGRAILAKAKEEAKAAEKLAKDAAKELADAKKAMDEKKLYAENSEMAKLKERLMGDPDWADHLAADTKQAQENAKAFSDRLAYLTTFFAPAPEPATGGKKLAVVKHTSKSKAPAATA